MEELGIAIFDDGDTIPFGKAVYMDQKEYATSPTHGDSFVSQVLLTLKFKLSNLEYNISDSFYGNVNSLSRQGLIIILNNKKYSTDKNEILSYVTSNPTNLQLESIKSLEFLNNIEIQNIYEFLSDDSDNYIEYNNFNEYVEIKGNELGNTR